MFYLIKGYSFLLFMAKKTCESRNRSPKVAKLGIRATLDILFGHLHTSIRLLLIQNLTHLFEVLVEVLVLDPLVLSVKVDHLGSVDRGGPIEVGGWIVSQGRGKQRREVGSLTWKQASYPRGRFRRSRCEIHETFCENDLRAKW